MDEESIGFPRPFLFCLARRTPALIERQRTAIALELPELLQRVRQGDRGARHVADGEWCVAMSADSSRVFPWPERAWRA